MAPVLPDGERRPPSADPLVQEPLDTYLQFVYFGPIYGRPIHDSSGQILSRTLFDGRLSDLLARRPDKIALLWAARCKAALGDVVTAEALYRQMIQFFPCHASEALLELDLLREGKTHHILQRLKELRWADPSGPRLPWSIADPKIQELLRQVPKKAERLRRAKAYLLETARTPG